MSESKVQEICLPSNMVGREVMRIIHMEGGGDGDIAVATDPTVLSPSQFGRALGCAIRAMVRSMLAEGIARADNVPVTTQMLEADINRALRAELDRKKSIEVELSTLTKTKPSH